MNLRSRSSALPCRLCAVVTGLMFLFGWGDIGKGSSMPRGLEPTVSLSAASLMPLQVGTSSSSPPKGAAPSNAGGSPEAAALAAANVGPVLGLAIRPSSVYFGSMPVGTTTAPVTVTVVNPASTPVRITSLGLSGPNASDFAQTNTCGISVAARSQCTIKVSFAPKMDGTRSGAISITDNMVGSPHTVSLMGGGTGQSMTLSADKMHLENTITNTPVFITGDAPQLLFVQLSNSDVETYLADRASRNFNALWVYPIDNQDQTNAPQDYYGNVPFDGADFTSEDPTYWAHIDYVMQRILAYGMVAWMNVAFVGTPQFGTSYYYNSLLNSSDATMTAYGQWLGNRYKNYPNIVWVLGGDAPATSAIYSKLADIGNGLQSADPNHLITLEACRECSQGSNQGQQSTLEAYAYLGQSVPSFMGLNWGYATAPNVVSECRGAYASTLGGAVPALMGEDWYEGEHSMTSLQVREESYWEVLSGCTLGRLFGNNAIWTMGGPQDTMGQTWESQLGSAGSVAEEWQGALMRSREFWLLVPDTNNSVLVSGYGSGSTLSVAARTSDGQTIIAYVPNGNLVTITIDMTKITSAGDTANCWWFNPSTGATTLIGGFATSGTQNFTPPDANDWVLVIDDANANLPAPGSTGS